jgi:hypothetical protein
MAVVVGNSTTDAYQAKMINLWDGRHRLTTAFTDLHLIQCNVCLAVFTKGQWRYHQRTCTAATVAAKDSVDEDSDREIEEKYEIQPIAMGDSRTEDNTQQQQSSAVSPQPTSIDLTDDMTELRASCDFDADTDTAPKRKITYGERTLFRVLVVT